jgi:hypothetical protein
VLTLITLVAYVGNIGTRAAIAAPCKRIPGKYYFVDVKLTNYNTRPVKAQLRQIVDVTKRHLLLFPGILLQELDEYYNLLTLHRQNNIISMQLKRLKTS